MGFNVFRAQGSEKPYVNPARNKRGSVPIGPKVVPFWGSYFQFCKGIPKKELLWGLWVGPIRIDVAWTKGRRCTS